MSSLLQDQQLPSCSFCIAQLFTDCFQVGFLAVIFNAGCGQERMRQGSSDLCVLRSASVGRMLRLLPLSLQVISTVRLCEMGELGEGLEEEVVSMHC